MRARANDPLWILVDAAVESEALAGESFNIVRAVPFPIPLCNGAPRPAQLFRKADLHRRHVMAIETKRRDILKRVILRIAVNMVKAAREAFDKHSRHDGYQQERYAEQRQESRGAA